MLPCGALCKATLVAGRGGPARLCIFRSRWGQPFLLLQLWSCCGGTHLGASDIRHSELLP